MKMFSTHKAYLIAQIKGLSEEIKKTGRRFHRLETKSDDLLYIKRYLSNLSRHYLLAYAFLRGISYSSVERKCEIKPNKQLIISLIKANCLLSSKDNLEEKVISWLGEKV